MAGQTQQQRNDFGKGSTNGQQAASAQTSAPPRASDLEALFERSKDLFAKVAAKHITPERLIKVALMARSRNEKLKLCTPESFLQCVLQAAELGLEPSGTYGGVHLVPRKNTKNGTHECTLVVDYRGLVELARRSGEIAAVEVGAVYAGDYFAFERGLTPALVHRPLIQGDRGDLLGFWAVVLYRDGGKTFEVMRRDEAEAIRDKVPYWQQGPWGSHFEAMGKKTCIRRAMNLAPKSPEYRRALEIEDAQTVDGELVQARPALTEATGIQVDFSRQSRASKVAADLRGRTVDAPPAAEAEQPKPEPEPGRAEPPPPTDNDGPPF